MTELYLGYHGELYDIFYADKPYAEEARFISDSLQSYAPPHSRRILELACGTGSHALELTKLGYRMISTDIDQSMLDRAIQKRDEQKLPVNFLCQDMCKLDVPGAPFDAAICLFDSIGYVRTNDNLHRVFQQVHDLLKPDGIFIFEFWHAAAMLRGFSQTRVRHWSLPERELLRVSETNLRVAEQLAEVAYTIYDLNKQGTYSILRELHINRYFLKAEMEYWLTSHAFTPVKWFAGFEMNEVITADTWHILAVAQRNG